jgi:hypothetical protein
MKGQGRLSGIGPSAGVAVPVIGAALAGLVVALTFTLTFAGCATQSGGQWGGGPSGDGPPGGAGPKWPTVYEVISKLDLDPEQLPVVRTILEETESAREDLRAEMMSSAGGGRPDPSRMSSMRTRMDEINETAVDRLSEILDDEQVAAYEKVMRDAEREQAELRQQMGDGPGGPGGLAGRPGR